MEYIYTPKGREKVNHFIRECEVKRKEILDAGIDTADETTLPTAQDILDDVNVGVGLDFEDEYFDCWGVTDHYSSHPISLMVGEDLVLRNDGGAA